MSTIQKNRWLLKRERNLLFLLIALLIAYFCMLFFLESAFKKANWFYIALLFESAYMFTKAYYFKSDSSLYLSAFLLSFGLLGIFVLSQHFSVANLAAILTICFALSHFLVFCFFKKQFHLYTFIFLFLLFLPIFLYSFNCINLLLMVSSICGVFLLTILAGIFVLYGKV